MDPRFGRVATVWCEITGVDTSFTAGANTVVTAPGSLTAPPGWIGTVRLGDAALLTAPTDEAAEAARRLVRGLDPVMACAPEAIFATLQPADILGPATLAYLAAADFRPVSGPVEAIEVGAEINVLETAAGAAEAGEADVADVTSPVFVTRAADGSVSAACGYRIWRDTLAHMCVLTHPDHRGRGLATMVGSAATAYALDAGLVPQWRARVPASIAVAAALGYTMLGAQLSFRLPDPLAP